YSYPNMDRPNFTVLPHALVTRVLIERNRANGVELLYAGQVQRFGAEVEVILSMGAIQTPKVLMQSGIGDGNELGRVAIPVLASLPAVGKGFQDHAGPASCMWEYQSPVQPRNNGAEATFFWGSKPGLEVPDIQVIQGEIAFASAEATAQFHPPAECWVLWPGLVRPRSSGHLTVTGPDPDDPVRIHAGTLEDPEDLQAMVRAVELCRAIGNSPAFRPYVKREVMPGPMKGTQLENFIRDAVVSVWHLAGTARMGRDESSVVDSRLRVHGITGLRVADASIMPRVTTGNTMAPSVIIGERAGEILHRDHNF
ncbi:MAG: GMC family oxidoreductase N-terminal domain-containing protein, partial [Acidobacteriaceae bacterium]|nr:GMC family oxidoreductase N-terminal domain-containing protein [Acidobacteriaceae bacterium]